MEPESNNRLAYSSIYADAILEILASNFTEKERALSTRKFK